MGRLKRFPPEKEKHPKQGDRMRLLLVGPGAIGASTGAWIAAHYPDICFLARGVHYDAIRKNGIALYQEGDSEWQRMPVTVYDQLENAPDVDVVLVAVKNFNLAAACEQVRARYGDNPIIVGLQNGLANQSILPRYFSKVIYGIAGYNAWMDEPGVVGYQKKGPIVLGVPGHGLPEGIGEVARIMNLGVPTVVADRFQDAAHCKAVINLANSLVALIGYGYRPIDSFPLFQKILSNMLYEGIQIIRAAGYRESRIGGIPGWALITAGAMLPSWLSRPLFRRNVRKMVRSSMSQDLIQYRRGDSEIDDINGYLLDLAVRHNVSVPYNRAVYALAKEEFAKPDFQPIPVAAVWKRIQEMR